MYTVTGLAHDRLSKVAYDPTINEEGLRARSLKLKQLFPSVESMQTALGQMNGEVALAGLYPGMPKVPGVDSLQCMNLAIGLIRQALEKFMENGGQIYWRDGSGPIGLMDLFS